MIEFRVFYKKKNNEVEKTAQKLKKFMEKDEIYEKLVELNKVGVKSQAIQGVLLNFLISLGFESERKELFNNRLLRPDYYNESLNTMVEVERGRTRSNNMDLLDVWKCHIHPETKHLFLIVPNLRPSNDGKKAKVFKPVIKIIESFFVGNNYINVDSCYVFGY